MPFTPPFRPVGPVRPTRGRAAGAGGAAAFALALLLGGCAGAPAPSPSGTPSASEAAPIFASDEEALVAAVEAYEKYRAASAEISTEGGAAPERIDETVTPEFAEVLYREFQVLNESGVRYDGTSTFDTVSLADWEADSETASVSIYLCRDVSGVRVVGPDSSDITPTERATRVPSQANLVSSDKDPRVLVVDGVEQWSGDDFC